MRGEVLHYDEEQAFGFISGADGNRYTFERSDLRRPAPVSRGTRVEFRAEGDHARQIFLLRDACLPSTGGVKTPASDAQFGRLATADQQETASLWGYFKRVMTVNYANFGGRARRKEYWGTILFWFVAVCLVAVVGFFIDVSFGNLDNEEPYVSYALIALFILATFIPNLALTIRRQHDIGLSGWFYLLILIPYIGGLIIFVFTLIPSQKHENKWGPIPAGVRI
jgi:uncharacterized membrane protein YhaH (DUF805 family)/cold shock CspA family protein